MPLCILIPNDLTAPIVCTVLADLTDCMSIIDGYLAPVPIREPRLLLLYDEDAVRKHRLFNRRASTLWWLLEPVARGQKTLLGDALLFGHAPSGEVDDIPDTVRRMLMDSDRFVVEARAERHGDAWARSTIEFSDYFEAAIVALQALSRWDDVRVIPVT